MTIGTTIAEQFEIKLNTPPVSPISRSGATVETTDQVIEAKPQPKKEHVMHAIASLGSSQTFARKMRLANKEPVTIGIFLASVMLKPCRSSRSERKSPQNHAKECGQKGERRQQPSLCQLNVPVSDEVHRKPREKKPLYRC